MSSWSAFYTVTGTAAAALLGLLFVAVSIGASTAFDAPHSAIRSLAEQSFQNYLLVLILSCVALFPATSTRAIGTTVLVVTASRALWALIRLGTIALRSRERLLTWSALRRQAASLIGIACLLVAAAHLALGISQDVHLLAAGTLILLASSAAASWTLLHELVKGRRLE